MNAFEQIEYIRLLELENKNLRAALIGARDNLRDAEVEMGRLRTEIRKVRNLLDHGGLPYRERENPGFPMSLLGHPDKVVPIPPMQNRETDWLEREMAKREREYQEKLHVIAQVQRRSDPQIDTIRIGGKSKVVPIGSTKDPAFHPMPTDEQGLTEEDKRGY
jgi:hypothetical protein